MTLLCLGIPGLQGKPGEPGPAGERGKKSGAVYGCTDQFFLNFLYIIRPTW